MYRPQSTALIRPLAVDSRIETGEGGLIDRNKAAAAFIAGLLEEPARLELCIRGADKPKTGGGANGRVGS